MERFFSRENIYFLVIIFMIYISKTNENYKEIDLKLNKYNPNSEIDLTLYIETNDVCSKWVPSLFSQIQIIKQFIKPEGFEDRNLEISFKENPASIKKATIFPDSAWKLYSGTISVFNQIFAVQSQCPWPVFCQFGLGYLDLYVKDVTSDERNYNSIKNLIDSRQIEKNIFSFGKWDFNQSEFVTSKLYIGNSHENFLEDNVGTCEIQNGTGYFGCIFNDFIFLNKTFPLINEKNNQSYIIYFSSELNKIYFPNDFKNKIENCYLEEVDGRYPTLFCEELKDKPYLPLKLRNDNMNITLEVDNFERFYDYSTSTNFSSGVSNINFHEYDYIIFPLMMFKMFHVQFDIENNTISFYTNDTSILEVPKKEEPTPTQNPQPTQDQKEDDDPDGPSAGLIVFLVILSILLIGGLSYGGFLIYKKKHRPDIEKRFNKYSKFEDEEINENKLVY